MQPRPPDQEPYDADNTDPIQPDWYGWRARKRKNDHDGTPNERLIAAASALVAIAVIVIGIGVIAGIVVQPFTQARVITITPSIPSPAPPQPTATPFPIPSSEASRSPSPTIAPIINTAPWIEEYGAGVPGLRTLPLDTLPIGSVLRGLRFHDGALYVALTSNAGAEQPTCADGEGYLILDTTKRVDLQIGSIRDPKMIAPRAIAFDSTGRAFIVAHYTEDCKTASSAVIVFAQPAAPNVGITTVFKFASLTASDIAITTDDRIFVTVDGFAGGETQKHLIELRFQPAQQTPSSAAGTLTQVDDYAEDSFEARYPALAITDSGLVMTRMRPSETCSLRLFPITPPTLTLDGPATLPPGAPTPAPTLTPIPFGIMPRVQMGTGFCPVILFTSWNGAVYGLHDNNRMIARYDLTTGSAEMMYFLPEGRYTGFALAPATGKLLVAGTGVIKK